MEVQGPTKQRLTWIVFQVARLFRPFLLIVGNLLCLVLLCLISARRDKVCPQYRVRNWSCTNTLQTPQKLSGPLGNSCTTFPFFFRGEMMRFWPSYSSKMCLYPTKPALMLTFCYILGSKVRKFSSKTLWAALDGCTTWYRPIPQRKYQVGRTFHK